MGHKHSKNKKNNDKCLVCGGSGLKNQVMCIACNGWGNTTVLNGHICMACKGTGNIYLLPSLFINSRCVECNGFGFIRDVTNA